ncbi:oligosaccharide flippase family protein [Rhizorhapis sp.]|uniref:oligosaccharide flippase family protein n=1 Tax=Rhizorhapis sp. TaxID=1968842 RepID=UPI002B49CE0F|nr:oligosaccharide flippase family protein [Rhizorhapis sp.]HKR16046.1 oligosaccharide flippase family protein [Rhizorhapis sp.]
MTDARALGPVEGSRRIGGLLEQALAFAKRDTNVVIATVVIANLLRAVSTVLLTRLLVPEAFGIAGIIGIIAFIMAMMSDLGFQAFVVRHADGDRQEFRDVVWTIRLGRSVVLTLLMMALAEPLALAAGKPEIGPAIAVSALMFLIDGCSALTVITALRERLLLRLSTVETLAAIVQLAVAVVLAFAWQSYWAIVIAPLIGGLAKSVLSYLCFNDARRRFRFDTRYALELWNFARFVIGSSIISMLLTQCDKIILARLFTLDMLGYYMLATNLALAPLAFTTAYSSRVLYPNLARAWRENPGELQSVFYGSRRRISCLYMLAAGGLAGTAQLVIAILYDDRYADAATFLQLLAISPLLALSSGSANEALTASGRVHVTFHANIAKLLWLGLAGPAALLVFGPIGLVAAVGSMEAPALFYSWWQLWRADLLRVTEELAYLAVGGAGILLGLALEAALLPYL